MRPGRILQEKYQMKKGIMLGRKNSLFACYKLTIVEVLVSFEANEWMIYDDMSFLSCLYQSKFVTDVQKNKELSFVAFAILSPRNQHVVFETGGCQWEVFDVTIREHLLVGLVANGF